MITQEEVQRLFDYDQDSGILTRRKNSHGGRWKTGQRAGWVHGESGYWYVRACGKARLSHRVIWLWVYGYLPEGGIDHINRDRGDNRIKNLREASKQCNARNSKVISTNTSGVTGVSFDKWAGTFKASVTVYGSSIHIGRYVDFAEAVCARLAAEQCLGWAGCNDTSPAYLYVKNMN